MRNASGFKVWPRGYKTFSMLNSAQFSRINTTSEILKARNFFICQYFSFYEQLQFCAWLM